MVPLTIPMNRAIRSPARCSRSGRMRGIPPPTAASKRSAARPFAAASMSASPWLASSSLFAVTTGFPDDSASSTSDRAGSIPPITSTTTSTDGSQTAAKGSSTKRSRGMGTSLGRSRSRTATVASSMRHPARREMSSACSWSIRITAEPTCPHPSWATLNEAPTSRPSYGRRAHRPRTGR